MEEINQLFAKKLQELRRLNNVKQEHIARALNMTQQNYSLLERGQRNFTIKLIKQICDYYKIPVTEFLNLGGNSSFRNSPLSNNSNNANSFNNDPKIIEELIKSKEEIIVMLKKTIEDKNQKIKELEEKLNTNTKPAK